MADSTLSGLTGEAPAKANLILYAVDPDEPVAADRSKKIEFGALMDSLVTHNGEIIVNNGNVVIGG